MAPWLILAAGLLYAWTAVDLAARGQYAMAMAFACYAAANAALACATR